MSCWPCAPVPCPGSPQKLQRRPPGVPGDKLQASLKSAPFSVHWELPAASRVTPALWNRTKGKKGHLSLQELLPSPALPGPKRPGSPRASRGHSPLPLHLALASLPCGGQTSRRPNLLLQRLPGPDKSHALTAALPQRPGCLLSVGFVSAVTVVPPRATKGWAPGTSRPHPEGSVCRYLTLSDLWEPPLESQARSGRKVGGETDGGPTAPRQRPGH